MDVRMEKMLVVENQDVVRVLAADTGELVGVVSRKRMSVNGKAVRSTNEWILRNELDGSTHTTGTDEGLPMKSFVRNFYRELDDTADAAAAA